MRGSFKIFSTGKLQGLLGGEGGIRTHGRFDPTLDFESSTFDHSATSPNRILIIAFGACFEFLIPYLERL